MSQYVPLKSAPSRRGICAPSDTVYLQATSGGTASTFRRLDKAPTVDDDPSECIELSSRRSSAGRARSATASTAFVQPRR